MQSCTLQCFTALVIVRKPPSLRVPGMHMDSHPHRLVNAFGNIKGLPAPSVAQAAKVEHMCNVTPPILSADAKLRHH